MSEPRDKQPQDELENEPGRTPGSAESGGLEDDDETLNNEPKRTPGTAEEGGEGDEDSDQ